MWVDRVRAVVQLHDVAFTKSSSGHVLPPTPPGSRSHVGANGEPASDALQNLSLSVLDAFGSAHDIIHQTELKNAALCRCG